MHGPRGPRELGLRGQRVADAGEGPPDACLGRMAPDVKRVVSGAKKAVRCGGNFKAQEETADETALHGYLCVQAGTA